MFIHSFVVDGQEVCGNRHELVADAVACEGDYWDWKWESGIPWCSHCDGWGHTAFSCPAPVW